MTNILLEDFSTEEKLKVHQLGLRHHSFSVFIFDNNRRLLLQRRSSLKYHSPNLLTNTCCGHYNDIDELFNFKETIRKNIKRELNIDFDKIFKIKTIEYNLKVGDLIENEIDDIYVGFLNLKITEENIVKEEISELFYKNMDEVIKDINIHPQNYTEWFKVIMNNENIVKCFNKILDKIIK